MPKITRSRISVFESPLVRFVGIVLVLATAIVGGSVFLGISDKGAIDVNDKIAGTNQDSFANRVNQNSNINDVNGGLKPASLSPDAQNAPEPVVPPPIVEGTSTQATTTDSSASTTEVSGGNTELNTE